MNMIDLEVEDLADVPPTVGLPDYVLLPLRLAGVDDPFHLRFYTEAEVRTWDWVTIGLDLLKAWMLAEGINFRTPGHSVFENFGPVTMAKLRRACVTHEVHFFEMDPHELEAIIGDAAELEYVLGVLAKEDIRLCYAQPKRLRGERGGKKARGKRGRKERVLQ